MYGTVLSLEPWDLVWRRNQHLVIELVRQGLVTGITFVEPLARSSYAPRSPARGVRVVTPSTLIPKRMGGLRVAARGLAGADFTWINDPSFGARIPKWALSTALYDVTDDWQSFGFPGRIVRRVRRAETILAGAARTVVCSQSLQETWKSRYGVRSTVVSNGIDERSWTNVAARSLDGKAPHVGYIGTLHQDRLDIPLVCELAMDDRVGTLHLVGPDALDTQSRALLKAHSRVRMHGAVPSHDVPGWTLGMDVLVSPHRISDFTMSLDAIKSREYVVSGRPVVATPTSGFQLMPPQDVALASAAEFADRVAEAAERAKDLPRIPRLREEWTWAARAREFHRELVAAAEGRLQG